MITFYTIARFRPEGKGDTWLDGDQKGASHQFPTITYHYVLGRNLKDGLGSRVPEARISNTTKVSQYNTDYGKKKLESCP